MQPKNIKIWTIYATMRYNKFKVVFYMFSLNILICEIYPRLLKEADKPVLRIRESIPS